MTRNLILNTTDMSGYANRKSITNVNPSTRQTILRSFSEQLNDLTTNVFVNTKQVDKIDIDAVTGVKPTPTFGFGEPVIAVTSGGVAKTSFANGTDYPDAATVSTEAGITVTVFKYLATDFLTAIPSDSPYCIDIPITYSGDGTISVAADNKTQNIGGIGFGIVETASGYALRIQTVQGFSLATWDAKIAEGSYIPHVFISASGTDNYGAVGSVIVFY